MERQRGERRAVVRLSPWADVVWGQREGSAACLCAVLLPIEIMKGGALGRMCSHHSLSVCHQSSGLCHPSPFSSSGPRRPRHCHHGHYVSLWHTTHSHSTHTHTQIVTGIHANIYMCHANMHFVWGQGVLWNTLIRVLIWQLSLRDSTIENHVLTFKIPFHQTIYAEDFTF